MRNRRSMQSERDFKVHKIILKDKKVEKKKQNFKDKQRR